MKRVDWIVVLSFMLVFCPCRSITSQVVLSEIMFHAPVSESYEEFIELYNVSQDWIDLSGYRVGDQLEQDSLVGQGQGLLLAPSGYALILDPGYWGNSAIYDSLIDQDALVLTISDGAFGAYGLRNSPADTIILLNSLGDTAAFYSYASDNPNGYSEEKIRLTGSDDLSNWSNSLTYLGTPGFANSVQPYPFDLAVVELQAAPSPIPLDSPLGVVVRLANLGLDVTAGGQILLSLGSLEFSVPELMLGEAGFGVVQPADSVDVNFTVESIPAGSHRLFAWHSLMDDNPGNDTLSVVLLGAYPPKSLIINEIFARPGGSGCEWVELYLPGTSDLNLWSFSFSDADTSDRTSFMDSSHVIAPGDLILLAQDSSVFNLSLPQGLLIIVLGSGWPALNDNGDTPTLFDAAISIQDVVPYGGWYVPAGISLERIYAEGPSDDPLNWQPSQDSSGGTPGRVNSYQPPAPGSSGSNLTFSPDPFDPDRHGALQITLTLPGEASAAAVIAFDLRGRKLKIIFDGDIPTGQKEILWDGKDRYGRRLSPGLYVMFAEFRDGSGNRKSAAKKTLVIAGRL